MPKRYHNRHLINRITSFFRPDAQDTPAHVLQQLSTGDLHALFWSTNDLDAARDVFSQRFDVQLGEDPGTQWDLPGLRQAWRHLETLPDAHIKTGNNLRDFDRSTNPDNQGYYAYDDHYHFGKIGIRYNTATLRTYRGAFTQREDPLFGLNKFKQTIRHEIGHALDHLRNYTQHLNPAGWTTHAHDEILALFINNKCPAATRGDIRTLLLHAFAPRPGSNAAGPVEMPATPAEMLAQLEETLQHAVTGPAGNAELVAAQRLGLISTAVPPVVDKARAGNFFWRNDAMRAFIAAAGKPYRDDDGGESQGLRLGGRIYQRNGNDWVSYLVADRAYKVSNYQYASPKEWFAEHYAAFYSDGASQAFKALDPAVYQFFKDYVDGSTVPLNPMVTR